MKKTVTLIVVMTFAIMVSNAFGFQDLKEFSFKNANSEILDLKSNVAVPGVPGVVDAHPSPAIVTAHPMPYVTGPKSIQTTLTAGSIQTTLTTYGHPR